MNWKSIWTWLKWPFYSVWVYLKVAWEGGDGKPSYRRVAQLVFLVLITFIVVKGQTQSQWGLYTLIVLCLTFLLLAAIITSQQVMDCFRQLTSLKSIVSSLAPPPPDEGKSLTNEELTAP